MSGPGSSAYHRRPGLGGRSRAFWQRVTEGLELQQLWNQFRSDVRSSYALYSADVDHKSNQETISWKRKLKMAQMLAWAILMKLSPARRVLLLVAVLLLLIPDVSIRLENSSFQFRQFNVPAGLLLLLLLFLEVADRVVMKRDLEIARDIQHWLLPDRTMNIPGLDLAFASRPANTVAGDYHDVLRRSPPGAAAESGPVLLAVADVVGKSIPAALLMATFQASLRTLAATAASLPEIVLGLNRYSCQHSGGGLRFTTAFVAEFQPLSGRLQYVNAGHNPPLVRRVSGAVEKLQPGGLPFGIRAQTDYECREIQLSPGDLLVVYTDGLVEAVDPQGREFEEARLLKLLVTCPCGTAADFIHCIMQELERHVAGSRQNDDITMLVMKPLAAG